MYRVIVIVLAFMLGVFIFFGADSAKTRGQKKWVKVIGTLLVWILAVLGAGVVLSGGMGLLEDRRCRNGRLLRDHRRDPRCRDLCPAAVLFQKNIAGKTAPSPPRRSRSAGVSLPRAGRARQGCPSPGAAK